MARDGEVVRTPMLIMDAAGVELHRPGFCCATDATERTHTDQENRTQTLLKL